MFNFAVNVIRIYMADAIFWSIKDDNDNSSTNYQSTYMWLLHQSVRTIYIDSRIIVPY